MIFAKFLTVVTKVKPQTNYVLRKYKSKTDNFARSVFVSEQ